MIIERILHFEGSKGRAELSALFDSGATYSCIHPESAELLAPAEPLPRPLDVEPASEGGFIRITQRVSLDFYLGELRLTDEFMVVPGLSEQAIIGATTLQKWRLKLDFEHDEVTADPRAAKLKLM
ncbi:MAG: hypothetical protein CO096_06190 [Armatimonadetes bacterium CG_4_9_14_3_um_filter_66_14]|nr:MAG: hypothetical protein CO096_06190 [Armatimonadetes bacterium CG_4_9_14_3_um_filter_66_14]